MTIDLATDMVGVVHHLAICVTITLITGMFDRVDQLMDRMTVGFTMIDLAGGVDNLDVFMGLVVNVASDESTIS